MNKLKPEILIITASSLVTCLFSVLAGFAGSAIIGTFWGWFWIIFLIQVIGFFAWNSFLLQTQALKLEESEIQLLEQLSKFTIVLTCAYCKQSNEVPIQLNQKNTFKCTSCNQTNGVFMQFTATTLTTPIESLKLKVSDTKETVEFKV